jgi:hypothetical protein
MKIIHLLILLTYSLNAFDQELENKSSLSILIGAKTRITPIYLGEVPDAFHGGSTDILERPDKHLSGPGIHITERYETSRTWSFALHQTVRYDYIYQKIPLVFPIPSGFEFTIKQKLLFDIYTDFAKDIPARNHSFRIFIGLAICGLNSGYTETSRVYYDPNNYTDYYTKRNFIFPAVTTGLGWQKNRLYAELKIGYCWDNPTLFDTPFLFPEISCQYQIFKFTNNK